MENRLIIDGRDVGADFGIWITDGGLNGLLSWPASKKVDTVDWAERDYTDADLSDLRLDARSEAVDFAMKGAPTGIREFCAWLSESVYRTWNIASIGRQYRVRYIGNSGLDASQFTQTFAVSVSVDSPLTGYEYQAPVSHIAPNDEFLLDGKPLSDYGVRVLLGTLDSTAMHPGVKERLKRDVSTIGGVIYDGGARNTLKSHQITLKCALIDSSLAGAWRNYDALLHDLIRKDMAAVYDTDFCKRRIYSQRIDRTFDCYYKRQSVSDFCPYGDRVWIIFDLDLEVVGDGAKNTIKTSQRQKVIL